MAKLTILGVISIPKWNPLEMSEKKNAATILIDGYTLIVLSDEFGNRFQNK